MSNDKLLETIARTVARIETTVNDSSASIAANAEAIADLKLNLTTLQEDVHEVKLGVLQLHKVNLMEDRLRVIDTHLGIDSRQASTQS